MKVGKVVFFVQQAWMFPLVQQSRIPAEPNSQPAGLPTRRSPVALVSGRFHLLGGLSWLVSGLKRP